MGVVSLLTEQRVKQLELIWALPACPSEVCALAQWNQTHETECGRSGWDVQGGGRSEIAA